MVKIVADSLEVHTSDASRSCERKRESMSIEHLSELRGLITQHLNTFERAGDELSLDTAVDYARQVGTTQGEGELRLTCLCVASRALLYRSELSEDMEDLDTALLWAREAVRGLPQDDSRRLACLIQMTNALLTRYESTNSSEDLAEAICWSRELTALCPADNVERRTQILSTYTRSLSLSCAPGDHLYELEGAVLQLKELICFLNEEDPLFSSSMFQLARACQVCYSGTKKSMHLDDAIQYTNYASFAFRESNSGRKKCLDLLGEVMLMKHRISADHSHFDNAIAAFRESMDIESKVPGRFACVKNMISLFDRLSDTEAISKAENGNISYAQASSHSSKKGT